MSAGNAPVRIERASNGWIITMGVPRLGDATPLPMVFDKFDRLVDYLSQLYGLGPVTLTDSLAWSLIEGGESGKAPPL